MEYVSKYARKNSLKFRKAIFSLIKTMTEKRISENKNEWILVTKRVLYNESGERKLSTQPTAEEKMIEKLTGGYTEIIASYDSMTEIPLYLKRFPSGLEWKSKYLEFVVVNYLNETYILSERLGAYTKKVSRIYKNTPRATKLIEHIKEVDKKMNDFFLNINFTRGRHVHEKRFHDDDLQRLVYLEILYQNIKTHSDKFVESEYKKALAFNKTKWHNFIEKRNKGYEDLLGVYFSIMYSVIFDKNGDFLTPE